MKKPISATLYLKMFFITLCFFTIKASAQTTQTFSSSGTWTCPYGVSSVTVEAWGAGGAGGGCTNKAGGGGGGGAFSTSTFAVTYGTTYTITVGTGGIGADAVAGTAGGASSFNAIVVANGGAGGGVGTGTDGAGGAGGAGTYAGGNGGTAIYATGSGGGGGGGGTTGAGGNGAALTAGTGATVGGGNGAAGRSGNGDGAAGVTYGGGGSGAKNTGANKMGGNGANGQVKVTFTKTCLAPPAQPTSLVLTPANTAIAGSFTAQTYAEGYLVIRTTTSSAPSNPVNGTSYAVGNTSLGGTVVYAGTATTFNATTLTNGTQYWFWVYGYNNISCTPGIAYLATSPLSNNSTAGAATIIKTYTTSTTWTCPQGVTSVKVECWGGGGAGGGSVTINRSGGGGAGGNYNLGAAIAVTPGTVYTVTVGAGGVGSTGNGTAGGASIFKTVTGKGGPGGTGANGSNGSKGSTASGGTNNGGDGGNGANSASGGGGGGGGSTNNASNAGAAPGNGTGGAAEGGNGGASVTTSSNGNAGLTLSGGGSGALSLNGTSYMGGAGSKGQVKLTYTNYCAAPSASATSLMLTPTSTTSISGSWTAALYRDGSLVIRTTTSTAPAAPVNGTTYTVGSTALGGYVEAAGLVTSFTSTSLSVGTTYWYWVYPYHSSSCTGSIVYKASNPLSGNATTNASTACTAPPAQPTALTFPTISGQNITGSFTAASPAPTGYLVIRTATSSAPTNPVAGTTYTAGTSSLGGYIESVGSAVTFSSSSLTASTTYWYWVYSYNSSGCTGGPAYRTTSPLSASVTTSNCGSTTNVATIPQTGSVDWTALTWSLGHVPSSCENVQLIFDGTTAASQIVTVNITSDVSVKNFTFSNASTSATYNKVFKAIVASGINLLIDGTLNVTAPAARVGDSCKFMSLGITTVTGNATFGGASDNAYSMLSANGITPDQTFIFKGNVTFNARSYINEEKTLFIMDGTGAQTLTNNTNTTPYADALLFEKFKIGNGVNSPTVTLAGTNPNFFMNDKGGYLEVTDGSTLIMPAGTTFNAEAITTAGVYNSSFYLRSNAKLKMAGNTGGYTGNNFPANFILYDFYANTTAEYNGSNAVTQTVYNGVTYGNLIVSNGTGSGTAAKNTDGDLAAATSIMVNPLTELTLGGGLTCTGPLDVLATGNLICGTNIVVGDGSFNLNSGATLSVSDAQGINPVVTPTGNIQMTGARSYSTAGNYIYKGTIEQMTGAGLPSTVANLTIDNPTIVTVASPLTITGTATMKQGVFDIGSTKLKITGSGTLASTGGKIKANAGILEMNGSSGTAQTLAGSWFVNRNISTLVNSNTTGLTVSATAGDSLLISSALLYGTGTTNSVITTKNNIVFLSRDTATARFGEIVTGSGNTITGNVTVERYIGSGRKWRLLSFPTTSTQTARQSWMENNTVANGNIAPGYGVIVTDEKTTWSTNNFDSRSVSGPSLKYWDEATLSFVGIPNTTVYQMNSKPAYFTYVRGDRSCLPANSLVSSTILRSTGTLKTGNQVFTVSANKFGTVGNPYASAIDLRLIDTANITSSFYVWDPMLTSTYGLGAYQTLYKSGTNYRIIPGGGSYGPLNSIIDTLESGQAMFVKARSSAGTVTFKEQAKAIGVRPVARTAAGDEESISALLSLKDPGANTLVDGCMAAFDAGYSNAVDYDDAVKMTNTSENTSFKRNNTLLAMEKRQHVLTEDTLFLNVTGYKVHQYQWDISAENLQSPGRTAFLIDKYLNTTTPLDLGSSNPIVFDVVNGVAASYATDRFMIVFRQDAAVLPVRFISVAAVRNTDKTVSVKWNVENEINMQQYTVEYSETGRNFLAIGTKPPVANNGGSAAYHYIDGHATAGTNYYRIRGTSLNGQVQYSAVVKVLPLNATAELSISPNPVTEQTVNLRFTNQPAGKYDVKITNMSGQVIHTETLTIQNTNMVRMIALPKNIPAGSYSATIQDTPGKQTTIPFIIQ